MKKDNERKGELIILAESTLWGLFPVITTLSFASISPLISLGVSTLFSAIFFAVVLTVKKEWKVIADVEVIKDIVIGTLFVGVFYYLLYFFGLKYTSPGNASIIALTEVFFSFVFFHIWKKEHIPKEHIIGAILMVFGAVIVLYPNMHQFKIGDILIMIAAFLAPFGNFYQQKARKKVSSEWIMFIRSTMSCTVLLLLIVFLHVPFNTSDIHRTLLLFMLNGVFVLGLSKILWIEGIHLISVTKATALESISPLITLLGAWIVLHTSPTIWQLFSFIPIFLGIILLGVKNKLK